MVLGPADDPGTAITLRECSEARPRFHTLESCYEADSQNALHNEFFDRC
jgi:hypothetical protein